MTPRADASDCLNAWRRELALCRRKKLENPQANPVADLADRISRDLEGGKIQTAGMAGVLSVLSAKLMEERALDLAARARLSELPEARERVVRLLAAGGRNDDFAAFAARWSRPLFAPVFTAHPTFSLSSALTGEVVSVAMGRGASGKKKSAPLPQKPDDSITLPSEHAAACAALDRFRDAAAALNGIILDYARKKFPKDWRRLVPAPFTAATWVGYDLDGRTDITWHDSFCLRLAEKAEAMGRLHEKISAAARLPGAPSGLKELKNELGEAAKLARLDVEAFRAAGTDAGRVAKASNAMTAKGGRLTDSAALASRLAALAEQARGDDAAKALLLSAAEVRATGFGNAEIQLRVNAVQVHNAMRSVTGHDTDGMPSVSASARLELSRLTALIGKTKAEDVNFGSLMDERTSAKRQMILAAQTLKHVDSSLPIRLLVAECEQPHSILSAIYLARLFGVDGMIDISPLFETPAALERGAQMLEQLLDNAAYRDYVAGRGRLCIQTGFSDSGRFIGQPGATMAIERLYMRLGELLKNRRMTEAEVVIFSTHGESMGRGAHPGDLKNRQHYLFSPAARAVFSGAGIPVRHESSFQGGDGYLFFATPELARATLTLLMEAEAAPGAAAGDPFYTEADFTADFFQRLRVWQQQMFHDPDYAALLGVFGTNLLYKTGSRSFRRQTDGGGKRSDPSQMRAIPHNAILQQVGYPANIVGGFGAAATMDPDRFSALAKNSARFRSILGLVERAKRLGTLNAVLAYARLLSSAYWMDRGYAGAEPDIADSCRTLSRTLTADGRAEAVARLTTKLRDDAFDLHRAYAYAGLPQLKQEKEDRVDIDLLHAMRVALVAHAFLLTSRVPAFVPQASFSRADLLRRALDLDIPAVIEMIRAAFPLAGDSGAGARFAEKASYNPGRSGDYRGIDEKISRPLQDCYDLIMQTGLILSHAFRAYG